MGIFPDFRRKWHGSKKDRFLMEQKKIIPISTHDTVSPNPIPFLIRFVGLFVVLVLLLFIPAGRLDWWAAWRFIGAYALFVIVFLARGMRLDPAQIQERTRTADNVKSWDKIILSIYTFLLLVMLLLAALDAGRFRWVPLSPELEMVGWGLGGLAGALIWWASSVNTFLSRQVRIQTERGHRTITNGPYRWVRHPMYAGLIIFIFCVPLVLDSGLALIPAGWIAVLMIIRTNLEDSTLKEELPGYAVYVKKVRYRLIPGIW
jgi:protein-S-isoprenylcysteine O-methyltransferase Ste14